MAAKPDAVSFYYRGLSSKENSRAIADFDKALSINPQYQEAYYHRGLARLGIVDGADVEGYAMMNPNSANTRIIKALGEPTAMEFSGASLLDVVDELKKQHKIDIQLDAKASKLASAWPAVTITQSLKGVSLRAGLRLTLPEKGLTYMVEGGSLLISTDVHERAEYEKVIADFDEAIRLNPRDALAHVSRGSAWLRRREFNKAAADFATALTLAPQSKPAHWGRGVAELALGNDAEGVVDLRKAGLDFEKYANTPTAKILAALRKPVTMELVQTPLNDAVDELKLESGIEIQVDRGALTAANFGPCTPINQKVKDVELRVALRKMLSAQGLRYGIENEVLLITTADKGVGK